MSRYDDNRIYQTFEEFEREELRRVDSVGGSIDELLDDMFVGELDFDEASVRRSRRADEEEE